MDNNELYEKCKAELNKYELNSEQVDLLTKQVKNVCDELAANQIDEDVYVIINEIFSENELYPSLKTTSKEDLNYEVVCKYADNLSIFQSEEINKITLVNKLGSLVLDFTKFEFPCGNLSIDIKNTAGDLVIYINESTEIHNQIKDKFAESNFDHYHSPKTSVNIISLQGVNKLANIEVITADKASKYQKAHAREEVAHQKSEFMLEQHRQKQMLKLEKERLKQQKKLDKVKK